MNKRPIHPEETILLRTILALHDQATEGIRRIDRANDACEVPVDREALVILRARLRSLADRIVARCDPAECGRELEELLAMMKAENQEFRDGQAEAQGDGPPAGRSDAGGDSPQGSRSSPDLGNENTGRAGERSERDSSGEDL